MAVAVGAASLMALAGCGEPTGQTSPNGMTYTVTADVQYLKDINQTVMVAAALCAGAVTWRYGTPVNADGATGPTISASVSCYPNVVTAGTWETKHS